MTDAETIKLYIDAVGVYAPKLWNYIKKVHNSNFVDVQKLLANYYYKELERIKNINTIYKNPTPVLFDEVYIPLSIESQSNRISITLIEKSNEEQSKYLSTAKIINKNDIIVVDEFPYEMFSVLNRVLIVDTAGMGKSTIIKKLFKEALKFLDDNHVLYLPVIVELRMLTERSTTLKSVILNKFEKDMIGVDEKFIFNLFKVANFIILFDGFDEVPVERKSSIIKEINDFIHTYPNNTYVISSRNEAELSNFGQFHTYRIKPLVNEEAYELIRRYSGNSSVGEDLIRKISDNKMPTIDEFLSNPLLISLLYFSYSVLGIIPDKRHLFYEKVFHALFSFHDITKDRFERKLRSKLNEDDFQRVLGLIAFYCIPEGYVELTEYQLRKMLDEFKKRYLHIKFDNSDFIYDCTSSVPLFIHEGSFRWTHKSMRDYFAATYWNRDKSSDPVILRKWANRSDFSKNISLLDLCSEIDTVTFRNTLELEFYKEMIEYVELFFDQEVDEIFFNAIIHSRYFLDTQYSYSRNSFVKKQVVDYEIERQDSYLEEYNNFSVGVTLGRYKTQAGFVCAYSFCKEEELLAVLYSHTMYNSEITGRENFYVSKLKKQFKFKAKQELMSDRSLKGTRCNFSNFDLDNFLVFLKKISKNSYTLREIISTNQDSINKEHLKYFVHIFVGEDSVGEEFKYKMLKEYVNEIEESIRLNDEEFSI